MALLAQLVWWTKAGCNRIAPHIQQGPKRKIVLVLVAFRRQKMILNIFLAFSLAAKCSSEGFRGKQHQVSWSNEILNRFWSKSFSSSTQAPLFLSVNATKIPVTLFHSNLLPFCYLWRERRYFHKRVSKCVLLLPFFQNAKVTPYYCWVLSTEAKVRQMLGS